MADVYVLAATGARDDGQDLATRIGEALATAALPDGLARVTVSTPAAAMKVSRYTFERGRDGVGFAENQVLRDLHPMVAERLHLWRLANFDLRRLPAADDVYVFHATGRADTDDRRVIALAELRDLTPLRDAAGSVTAIPALEQVLDSCLDALRAATAGLSSAEQPQWNRIVLHVWPVIDLEQDELLSVLRTLAPRTVGTGLEQVGIQGRIRTPDATRDVRLRMAYSAGAGVSFDVTPAPRARLKPLDAYVQQVRRVLAARHRISL